MNYPLWYFSISTYHWVCTVQSHVQTVHTVHTGQCLHSQSVCERLSCGEELLWQSENIWNNWDWSKYIADDKLWMIAIIEEWPQSIINNSETASAGLIKIVKKWWDMHAAESDEKIDWWTINSFNKLFPHWSQD